MSNDETLIGRKVKHTRFGEGVISQIRYKGAEYYIKFQNKLNAWVKAPIVEISTDNLEPKESVNSIEEIITEFTPITDVNAVNSSIDATKTEFTPITEVKVVLPSKEATEFISKQVTIATLFSKEPKEIELQPSNEFESKRMIEAFRLGIVPFYDVENFTFGRNVEIKKINNFFAKFNTSKGECVFLEAEYGSGKTHFLDYLYYVVLKKGYLVAKSRINAEDVPPYKPKQVYRDLVHSMRYLDNYSEKNYRDLLKKVSSPNINTDIFKEHRFFNHAIEIIKNDNDIEEFYRWIEGDTISRNYMNYISSNLISLPTLRDYGTVADNYCYILSGIGNMARLIGLKGFVILIDEGEKFWDPLISPHHKRNALNFFGGLTYTSINKNSLLDEDSGKKLNLFHSRTGETPFIYNSSSNIFLVIAFTDISESLKSDFEDNIIKLSKFNDGDLKLLFEELVDIYQKAYYFRLNNEQKSDVLKRIMNKNDSNLRWFVKSTIEALDLLRHYSDKPLDEVLEYE